MTIEQLLEDCAYDTELKTTEKVTKKVTEDVTIEMNRKYIFGMLEQSLSSDMICKIANITEDQFAAYKEEYDKQKSE